MENTIVSGGKRTFIATLFGVTMLILGDTALAATAPTVAPLKFEYAARDANGNTVTLENKITTGYEANRVAVDGKGNVYVTDAVSNTLSVFNTNGKLVKGFSVNRAFAVGADSSRGLVYVGGVLNETSSIFILDNNNDGKDDSGNLGTGWGRPMGITVAPSGNVYVVDVALGIVRKIDVQGATRDYGPFGGERYAGTVIKDLYGRDTTFSRTRHRMLSPQATAVDETNGLIYVGIEERVEFLSAACQSIGGVSSADGGGRGTEADCYNDTGENWKYYNDVLGVPTDLSYKYWNSVNVGNYPDSAKRWILVVDISAGTVKSKIMTGNGSSSAHVPRGLALDGKGRLYVATTGGGTAGGQIKVYNLDANPIAELLLSSGFTTGIHTNVAFSPDIQAGAPKGRIFATMGDSNRVYSYSIDYGANPANTAPTKPVLIGPVSSTNGVVAAVNSSTPTLRITNSTDAENDPLSYAYEICIGSCAATTPVRVTSAVGITGGSNNETSMMVTQEANLLEDTLYHWRAQSFDGQLATWSDEAVFCVDVNNTNPSVPTVIAPLNMAIVSPFASSLLWNASTDSDCSNDTVTYEVVLSDSHGNILNSFTGLTATSINISDISGLISGNIYNWIVRAADNRGGKSEYSAGSFTYKTTSVKLDSDQPGTKVYIDGNYGYYGKSLGAVPVEKTDVLPGSHFVTFIKEGYEPHYTVINVTDPAKDSSKSFAAYSASMVAASRIEPEENKWVEIARVGGYASPFVVDYNNDGLKDMIVGGGDGRLYLYLSEETVQADGTKKVVLTAKGAVQAGGADITVGTRAVPFVVDYNNDGRKDLLVGSGDGLIYLYENTGTESAPSFALAGNLKDGSGNDIKVLNSAPAMVDYNNDGRKDLVVGGFDGKLRLYKNIMTDASPVFDPVYETITALDAGLSTADLNVGSDSKPFFTDWNSDGKKDIVVGRGIADPKGNTVNLFLNVGTDDAPSFVTTSGLKKWIKDKKRERGNREFIPYLGYNEDIGDLTNGSGGASPFVVDWDGTSARDVIVGNGSGGAAAYITE